MLVSILLLSIQLPTGSSENSSPEADLSSDTKNGSWVNNTLTVSGTTNIAAQNANWVLYDVTEVYTEWPVLRSGEYFSEVTPIDDSLWNWSITIDVQGLNCTCWLEVSQPDGLSRAILTRVIFIGEGPHNPLLSPLHDELIVVDEPVLLTTQGILSDNSIIDSEIILSWCHAPNGACEGQMQSAIVDVTWDVSTHNNIGTFIIDAAELDLYDGAWEFSYVLQDMYLRTSPLVSVRVLVDQTDPEAVLICPSEASEGDIVVIDGSDSQDGVWSSNLQSIWYITNPDGSKRVANQSEINGMVLKLSPTESGNYLIQLDVFDIVGRRSSQSVQIVISNIAPELDLQMKDNGDVNPNSWILDEGENLELSTFIRETGADGEKLVYEWYLNDELISNSSELVLSDLDVGTHELRLVVIDDDGESDSHEMDIIVKGKISEDKREINIFAIVLIIAIIVGILLFAKRMNKSENESTPMPKWNRSRKSETEEHTNSEDNESEFWNDSN